MKKYIFYTITLASLISCSADFFDKKIDIELNDTESKLAPTAFLGVDFLNTHNVEDTLSVLVSYTENPLLDDNQPKIITEANVIFQGEDQSYPFLYEEQSQQFIYANPINFTPNSPYTLTIDSPNYNSVSSSQTYPEKAVILSAEKTSNFFKIKINDNPNQQNFYLLRIVKETEEFGFISVDLEPFTSNLDESGMCDSCILFNDTTFNGEQDFEIVAKHFQENTEAVNYKIILFTTTQDFYKYDTSIRISEYAEGNPFVEPVIIHNNFENGYGIFALLNKTEISILAE